MRNGYYFIAPDNGILSLIADDFSEDALVYLEYGNSGVGMFEIISRIVSKIINSVEFSEIGLPVDTLSRKISFKPVISNDTIRATVLLQINSEMLLSMLKGMYLKNR